MPVRWYPGGDPRGTTPAQTAYEEAFGRLVSETDPAVRRRLEDQQTALMAVMAREATRDRNLPPLAEDLRRVLAQVLGLARDAGRP